MVVSDDAVALPRLAVVKLWEWEGYGTPHPVVGVDDYWLSSQATGDLERAVFDELERQGLARSGTLTADFRDTLHVLARAGQRYFALVGDLVNDRTGGAMVAELGGDAVRMVREDDVVSIERVYPEQLAEQLVDTLPYVEGAAIEPMAVPRSDFARSAGSDDDDYQVSVTARLGRPTSAERLRKLLALERFGAHQLYAGKRARADKELTSEPLTVIDIVDVGRMLSYVEYPEHDEPRITCVSGDWETLVRELLYSNDALE